jgi:excisionase family DNA binding protein
MKTSIEKVARVPIPKDGHWLTYEEAAEYAGVSRRTLWGWVNEGGLCHSRVGKNVRIHSNWLDEYLTSFAVTKDAKAEVARQADALLSEAAQSVGA